MSRLVVAIAHVEFTIANQTLYVVKVQQDADEWEVRRTYSDFRKLRDDIARVMKHEVSAGADACSQQFAASAHDLPFPAKRLFGSRSNRVVRERAVELHQFLIKLLLLTHTYRKAQKQLYDAPTHSHSHPPAHAHEHAHEHHQASVSVFYLLRDFLKPVASVKTGSGANGSAHGGSNDTDDDSAMRRMIRESKMLSMRSSSGHHPASQSQHSSAHKTMSAPNVLAYGSDSDERHAHGHAAHAALLRQQSSIPILEERHPAARHGEVADASDSASKKTLNIALLRSRSQRTDSNSDRSLHSADDRHRNVSNASSASSSTLYASSSRKASGAAFEPDTSSSAATNARPVVASVQQSRIASSLGAQSSLSTPIPIAIAPPPPPPPSSTSSSVYLHGSAPSSTSSTAAYAPSTTSSNTLANARMYAMFYEDSDDESASASGGVTTTKAFSSTHASKTRPKAHDGGNGNGSKKPAARTKARSASAREARSSERKSKLSPQLTAQAVTLAAQRELEQFVSEYSALMVLRYVDRFISKAVTKTPGCYTVSHHRLVIDSERFFEELDETFKDLPAALEQNFHMGGDWAFPPALDAYVQMKWKSFQGHAPTSSSSSTNGGGSARHRKSRHSRRVAASDSDSEETEYEYEETLGGGYMKPKRVFTDEVADVLDKMIAEGTAGRDQMLRLRRQKNEMGWDRRANPSGSDFGGKKTPAAESEYWTDTEDDEHRQTSGGGSTDDYHRSTAVEHYQQKYNALRKERLSRREGGLV